MLSEHPRWIPWRKRWLSPLKCNKLWLIWVLTPILSWERLIQVDISGHPYIPTDSSWHFLAWHILLYFFVIVGSTLLGLSEALHSFQVEIGGFPPNPTCLFWKFSCQYIFLYFEGCFGALNNVFLARHRQNVDRVRVLWCNAYFSKIPFQWAITRLKRRSYAKVTTSRS